MTSFRQPESSGGDVLQWIKHARSLRSLMRSDPHRPIYHFVAPEGAAMPFDPNGAIYWKGKYHLGFIYQKRPAGKVEPLGPDWAQSGHVWGHAVSADLLHWTQYPDMLDVEDGEGEIGIFSGSAFLSKEGVPHLIYHSYGPNTNRIAYAADDELRVWKKFAKPALEALDPNDAVNAVSGQYSTFDPEAWYDKDAGCYYQISGGMKPALFKSADMHDWEYLGDLIDKENTMRHPEEDIACPAFFSLGNGKSMLLFISHALGAQYYIGTFANDRFHPEQHGRMNWPGGTFFAPEQLRDGKGRNLIWGWIVERKPADLPAYGWAGIMSLPRVVSLGSDARLQVTPPEELKRLRVQEMHDEDVELAANSERTLRARGKSIEIQLEFSGQWRAPAGVKVFASPDGREETVVFYDPAAQELVIDFSKSSARAPVAYPSNVFAKVIPGYPEKVSQQRAPLRLKDGEPLRLNLFLDSSVLEVFANDALCVTQVVYPEWEASTGVKIFSADDTVAVKAIRAWTMAETNAC